MFYGSKSLHIIDRKSDKKSGILITDTKLNYKKFLLGHLYYLNAQSEQNKTLDTLKNLLENIDNISDKKIIFVAELNLVFNCSLEACGGNPVFLKIYQTKFIEIKENLDLGDNWRIRNLNSSGILFVKIIHLVSFTEN